MQRWFTLVLDFQLKIGCVEGQIQYLHFSAVLRRNSLIQQINVMAAIVDMEFGKYHVVLMKGSEGTTAWV
jgi:hypothetical protein